MSHIDPRAKIALGFAFLTLSMSVTFFSPESRRRPDGMNFTSFAEVRRPIVPSSDAAHESERLLREVSALHEELNDLDRIEPAVSSPAPR